MGSPPDAAERRNETGTGRPVTVGSTSVAVGVAVGLSAKVVAFGEAPRVTPKPVHAAVAGGRRHRRSLTPGAAKAIVSSPWNARLGRRERVEQLRAELDAAQRVFDSSPSCRRHRHRGPADAGPCRFAVRQAGDYFVWGESRRPKWHAEQSMKKTPIDPVPGGVSIADVTERLMVEFGAVLPLADVSRAVLQSFRDLAGAPVGALRELAERLARQLLHEAAGARG